MLRNLRRVPDVDNPTTPANQAESDLNRLYRCAVRYITPSRIYYGFPRFAQFTDNNNIIGDQCVICHVNQKKFCLHGDSIHYCVCANCVNNYTGLDKPCLICNIKADKMIRIIQ